MRKRNVVCFNTDCDYRTDRLDELDWRELADIVKSDGGMYHLMSSTCPKCKRDSLDEVLEYYAP